MGRIARWAGAAALFAATTSIAVAALADPLEIRVGWATTPSDPQPRP